MAQSSSAERARKSASTPHHRIRCFGGWSRSTAASVGRFRSWPFFVRSGKRSIRAKFGEVGLDHELVEASEDSFIELTTGCLCCKIRTDLAQTLQDLLQRRDAGRCSAFDRIVIETSGLADPAPILQTLMTDTSIAGRLVLGGVVATVDSVAGASTLQREDISQKQVAIADAIVLTKLDLNGPAQPALLRRLTELNAGAPVLSADRGKIDSQCLFSAGPYDPHASERCGEPRPAGGDPRRPARLSRARLAQALAVG